MSSTWDPALEYEERTLALKKLLVAALSAALISSALVAVAPAAQARSIDDGCADVEVVWARGSGQKVGVSNEFIRFRDQLKERIPPASVTLNLYELAADKATGGYGGHSYEAIAVGLTSPVTSAGAKISGGFGYAYGRSVNSGVGELYNYLKERQAKCSGSRFILGGYSQGAQVVSQTLEKINSENAGMLARIDFGAMFADPKLHLPEGEGIYPPACRGEAFSSWRRTVPNCLTDNGSLGARKPYVPDSFKAKAGLWCYDEDLVCGSSGVSYLGHLIYAQVGGAIDEAAKEIADRLQLSLPPAKAATLKTGVLLIGTGTTGLDVAFVIDTTGSMGDDIDQALAFARSSAATIKELRGRVALIAYRDVGDTYTAKVFAPLASDLTNFQAQLDGLAAGGGGDTPEALLHALMTTLNGLNWRPGATKAAVVLTDADFHQPDQVDGATVAQVAARALEIDPVNVYPVVPDFLAAAYKELADRTSGAVIINGGDTEASLKTALTKLRNRPVALLPLTDYYGQPGQSFTFDASKSYVAGSTITGYEWDFDGDGVFDTSTPGPITTHQYAKVFDGSMQVRVRAADGGVANASALVHVGTVTPGAGEPAAPRNLKAAVLSTVGGVSTVRLTWTPADTLANRWGISVNGVQVGITAGTTSVDVTDVQRAEAVTFGVRGLTAGDKMGATATVTLPKAGLVKPTLDIMPGSATNPLVAGRPGVVPVALLTAPGFNATSIDFRTACFGSEKFPAKRDCTEAHMKAHREDVDRDGDVDLVLHFEVRQTGIALGDRRACLSAKLPTGASFEACDVVAVKR